MSTSRNPNPSGSGGPPVVLTYEAPFTIFAVNWSTRNDKSFRLAISSVYEDEERVQILQPDPHGVIRSDPALSFRHPFTCACSLAFIPDEHCRYPDLLASAAEILCLWRISDSGGRRNVELTRELSTTGFGFDAQTLTSLDWNATVPRRIAISCSDNTCAVWDVESGNVEAIVREHNDVVQDVSWGAADVLASASNDGTVRISDLRRGGVNSRVVYEERGTRFGKIEWSRHDPNYMATTRFQGSKILLLDARRPGKTVAELQWHEAVVNAFAWAPNNSRRFCTVGDDSRALIWEIPLEGPLARGGIVPILEYSGGGGTIDEMKWSELQPEWVAIALDKTLQMLRV